MEGRPMAKSCSQFPRGLDSGGCFLIYLPGLFFLMVSCEGRAKDRNKFFYPLIYNDRLRACPYDGIPIDPGIRSAGNSAVRYAMAAVIRSLQKRGRSLLCL
jgi:hypothetical protein